MNVFEDYAAYYDSLYAEKDYASEATYVLGLLRQHGRDPRSLLELGCGTGAHAQHFAELQVCVHGVDRSQAMLERACARLRNLSAHEARRMAFSEGDLRDVRLGRVFDSVISLFHVMSYQTRNDDVKSAFVTAKEHLQPGGIFLFDCWYGPAVLAQKPEVRCKRWSDDKTDVLRIAEPTMHPNKNRVDVHYTILVTDKRSGVTKELQEVHSMRYLFRPEVEMFAALAGLEVIDVREWMTSRDPGLDSWNVCVVARR